MTRVRIIFFIITLIVVGGLGIFTTYYARGYRFDLNTFSFQPNGILVLRSEPDGASVFINGELKGATNANLSIAPGVYDVEIKKDGYFTWNKRLTVSKEIVTQATISLFKVAPSLNPVTLSGATNIVASSDGSKLVYSVLPDDNISSDKTGLWELDTFSLPLGFNNGPKRITDGDMTNATYSFSPDSRQILLNITNAVFLLDTGTFTAQNQRVNIASRKSATLADWKTTRDNTDQSLLRSLPPDMADILSRKASTYIFSPDSSLVLYTASVSATLPDNLIKPLPGASTQTQERSLVPGRTYIYDIKEDKNFFITDSTVTINNIDNPQLPALRFMSSSRNLLWAGPNQIIILDYDGTNKQTVYSGSYIMPSAFPYSNTTKLLILTNLGSNDSTPNLYTLTVK